MPHGDRTSTKMDPSKEERNFQIGRATARISQPNVELSGSYRSRSWHRISANIFLSEPNSVREAKAHSSRMVQSGHDGVVGYYPSFDLISPTQISCRPSQSHYTESII